MAVPALDQFARSALPVGGAVAQIRRTVAVHQRLAGYHAQAARRGGLEERIHRAAVYGREHLRGGGTVAQQFVEKEFGNGACVRCIAEARLGRIGVALEPVEQVAPVGGDHVELRIMDVGVDEARRQQARAVIDELDPVTVAAASNASAGPTASIRPSATSRAPRSQYSQAAGSPCGPGSA